MKEKQRYKKIVKYEKKPSWDKMIGGFFFFMASFMILIAYLINDTSSTILIFIMTLMFIYGCKFMIKGMGKERKTYYIKENR